MFYIRYPMQCSSLSHNTKALCYHLLLFHLYFSPIGVKFSEQQLPPYLPWWHDYMLYITTVLISHMYYPCIHHWLHCSWKKQNRREIKEREKERIKKSEKKKKLAVPHAISNYIHHWDTAPNLSSYTLLLFVSKNEKQFMFYFCLLNGTFGWFITLCHTVTLHSQKISSLSICTSEQDWKQYYWKKNLRCW